MRGYLIGVSFLIALIGGCQGQPDARFWIARPAPGGDDGWQIYYGRAWHDVVIDGVRPPSYVAPHILTAGNRFMFAGSLDTAGISRTDLPVFRLQAWNVLPPIRRQLVAGAEPDTTGLPWLTRDDFTSLVDYQRFSLLSASQRWPWKGKGMELPDSSDASQN